MTVDAFEDDRVISTDGVEFLGGRKDLRLPETFVPSAAGYPSSGRNGPDGLRNPPKNLRFG